MNVHIYKIQKDLESIRKVFDSTRADRSNPIEFWSARDLMSILGYKEWRKFVGVIEKAKEACKGSVGNLEYHFVGADKMVLTGSGAKRRIDDYLLTRLACYLITQNGDPRKSEISLAQMYFATQTRKQEILEQIEKEDKRLEARAKLKETEKNIESTVYRRGIKKGLEFATFKNLHIQSLYGGMSTTQLKVKKNIPKARPLADFDSHVELKAKDLALAMTDHNIKENNILGKENMNKEVIKNSKETRRALLNRGIILENIKSEEDLKLVTRRRSKSIYEVNEILVKNKNI